MKEWLRIAGEASVRRRALRTVAVVGSILITINHGDAILHGEIDRFRLLKMALTLFVPYLVSTFSSVGAIRELRGSAGVPPLRAVPKEEALERLAS
jgi:hypothetical protein